MFYGQRAHPCKHCRITHRRRHHALSVAYIYLDALPKGQDLYFRTEMIILLPMSLFFLKNYFYLNLKSIKKKYSEHLLSPTQNKKKKKKRITWFSFKDHSFVLSSNNGNDKWKHSLSRYSYSATKIVVFHLVSVSSI